jgi:hypothetical protein
MSIKERKTLTFWARVVFYSVLFYTAVLAFEMTANI